MTLAQRWATAVDARVLAALHDVPDSEPLEALAHAALVPMTTLRAALQRLALRHAEALPTEDDA